eukprot:TRINITY_DN1152_c0_g2_i5.p1 TRINITY_DN1152_c0_g2~~TRINITY_DN1152_c0_g2_i5.p1  ORF type:complete len:178 (-),score=49.01 TRINITY_DN1152_c0_g2_i5:66-599(-)
MFFSGRSSLPRPFGDVILDGVDLDIEGGSSQYYDLFVKTLKEKTFKQDPSRRFYISGAPQCVFPDAYLSSALNTGAFDYVFVQFYNNWCGVKNFNNPNAFNWNQWEKWASDKKSQIFLGVPADTYAGGGYVDANTIANILNSGIKNSPAYGGVMIWDATVSKVNGFGAKIASLVHKG